MALSATFGSARVAAGFVEDSRVQIVDGSSALAALGLVVRECARRAQAGAATEEVVALAHRLLGRTRMVMRSPDSKLRPPTTMVPRAWSMRSAPAPVTQGLPMPRATIAAWQVRPPRLVTIAAAVFMTGSQSGVVVSATRTSPGLNWASSARLPTRWAVPTAILSPTDRPSASTSPCSESW